MHTYVPAMDHSLVSQWLSEMRKLGIDCDIHPRVSLASHSGFLPFKIRIHDSAHHELNGVEFLTGFEYYIDDFSLEAELKKRPKTDALGHLSGERHLLQPYATAELDEKLKQCRKRLTFSWGSADLFELRMATVSSAILAEITGGVSSYPADGIWYDRPGAAAEAVLGAQAYENSLKPKNIKVHRFEKWL